MGWATLGLGQASRLSQGEGGGRVQGRAAHEEGPQLSPWEQSLQSLWGQLTDSRSSSWEPGRGLASLTPTQARKQANLNLQATLNPQM